MRQYLKNEVFKVSKWVELFISAIIMIAVIGGTIYLVKDVVQLMMNYPTSRDIYKFVGVAFNLVICIEFVKMLCKHTPDTLVEVMMFAIARQMIVEHTSPQQNLIVVLAIAILFTIKKFFFGKFDDNKEFLSLLKTNLDLFAEQVYCFTPNGDVKNLANGSTPIDFAYSIHSAVGNKMVGARVNGRQVPFDYHLQNGDRVEIITSQNSKGPSRDWLGIVKSAQARSKINQWFKRQFKEENIVRGKELLEKYCKSKSIRLPELMKPEYIKKVELKYGFKDWDSVCAAVGHGGLKEGQVINKMQEEDRKIQKQKITDEQILQKTTEAAQAAAANPEKKKDEKSKGGIVVRGANDVAVRFSKCCNPVPGDEIVGFITRGRGISIHRTDCVNLLNMPESDRARLIEAEWQVSEADTTQTYTTEINIYANNRKGLLAEVSKIFLELDIDIITINVSNNKKGRATLSMSFDITGVEQLNRIIAKIRNVEGVIDIERTAG